jgi:hypothetical protein
MRNRLVVAERRSKVTVKHALPVTDVLLAEWPVEAIGVASGLDIGGWRSFAQYLLDRVSGDKVNEKEDEGDD